MVLRIEINDHAMFALRRIFRTHAVGPIKKDPGASRDDAQVRTVAAPPSLKGDMGTLTSIAYALESVQYGSSAGATIPYLRRASIPGTDAFLQRGNRPQRVSPREASGLMVLVPGDVALDARPEQGIFRQGLQ